MPSCFLNMAESTEFYQSTKFAKVKHSPLSYFVADFPRFNFEIPSEITNSFFRSISYDCQRYEAHRGNVKGHYLNWSPLESCLSKKNQWFYFSKINGENHPLVNMKVFKSHQNLFWVDLRPEISGLRWVITDNLSAKTPKIKSKNELTFEWTKVKSEPHLIRNIPRWRNQKVGSQKWLFLKIVTQFSRPTKPK